VLGTVPTNCGAVVQVFETEHVQEEHHVREAQVLLRIRQELRGCTIVTTSLGDLDNVLSQCLDDDAEKVLVRVEINDRWVAFHLAIVDYHC